MRGRRQLVAFALIVSGCGSSGTDPASTPVTFEASDGVKLVGQVFGEGEVGVVLAHMGRPGDTASEWEALARALAERGYTALTYHRRGVCSERGRCSSGSDDFASSWKDVVGASAFLRARGAEQIALIGASLGAMACLYALVTRRVEAAAFVDVAGVNHASGYAFSRAQLHAVKGHKLFVSASDDVYGGAVAAREWYQWAREPKQLEILEGSAHGTDMLAKGQLAARPLTQLLLAFLTRAVPPARQSRVGELSSAAPS
jgi:pimeloyl-ACP methyl ester carboxylesterase